MSSWRAGRSLFWALTALLAYAGVRAPVIYLITFNLAFATYAFVDVVCDALMVTEGRRLGRVGGFVNSSGPRSPWRSRHRCCSAPGCSSRSRPARSSFG